MKFSKSQLAGFAILTSGLGGCGMFTAHYTGTETSPLAGSGSGSSQVTMTLVDNAGGKVRGTYGSNSPLFQAGQIDATANGDTLSNFTIDMYSNVTGGSACRFQGNVTSSGPNRDQITGSLVGSGSNCNGQIKNIQVTRVK